MKHSSIVAALAALSLTACGQKPAETPPSQASAAAPFAAPATPMIPSAAPSAAPASSAFPPSHPSPGLMPKDMGQMAPTAPPPLTQKAQVVSAISVKEFTYLELKQDDQTRWIATTAPAAATAKKGDTVQFDNGTTMSNFNSKALNRTFPSITLVGRVVIGK